MPSEPSVIPATATAGSHNCQGIRPVTSGHRDATHSTATRIIDQVEIA